MSKLGQLWRLLRTYSQFHENEKLVAWLGQQRWKGQIKWSTRRGSGAPMFIGNVFQAMEEEAGKAYLQKLKAQNVAKATGATGNNWIW